MEYNLRVLANDEKTNQYEYTASFGGIKYPDMKSMIEKLTVYLEENMHPIILELCDNNNRYNSYRLYFTRKVAKEWLHKYSPCGKTDTILKFRAVDWNEK